MTSFDPTSVSTGSQLADKLIAKCLEADPMAYDLAEIQGLQMQAAHELFEIRRKQIGVLDKRAKDLGIEHINSPEDLVPLLFSHQTYKSYPESFVKNNKWAMMNRWLDTLSTQTVGDIDVSDIGTTDAWVARLSENGHHVLLSSGTSGKTSFLNRTEWDVEFSPYITVTTMGHMLNIPKGKKMPTFLVGPNTGTHIFVKQLKTFEEAFGRADATYWLSDLPVTEAEVKYQAALRNKVNDGTATPGEIKELEEHGRQRQDFMKNAMEELAAALLKYKDEPVFVAGLWLPQFLLMEAAHSQGSGNGILHPDSMIFFGGGSKGAKLPADYREQIKRFYGLDDSRYINFYGMTELSSGFGSCSAGRYHITPWIIPLILNDEGDKLMNKSEGRVEGRMAFFDTAVKGRWGGVISSDKVDVDFSPCPCGRHSPSVVSVMRYTDLPGGDDKLSCAGTMSSYVRGVIED